MSTITYSTLPLNSRGIHLQQQGVDRVRDLLDVTGFFDAIAADPFSRQEWQRAVALAPTLKQGFHTVLSEGDRSDEIMALLREDARLTRCFQDC